MKEAYSTNFFKGMSLAITKNVEMAKKAEDQKTYGLLNGKVVVTTNAEANANLRQKVWEAAQAITKSKRKDWDGALCDKMSELREKLGITVDGTVVKEKKLLDRDVFQQIIGDIKQLSGSDLAADKTNDSFSAADEFLLQEDENEIAQAREGLEKEVEAAIEKAFPDRVLCFKSTTLIDLGIDDFKFMAKSMTWSQFVTGAILTNIEPKLEEAQRQILGKMLNCRTGSLTIDTEMWKKAEELASESVMPPIHNFLISLDLLRNECIDAGINEDSFAVFLRKLVTEDAATVQKMLLCEKSSDRRKLLETAMEKIDPESKKTYDIHVAKSETQRTRTATYRLERLARAMSDQIVSCLEKVARLIAEKQRKGEKTETEQAKYIALQTEFGKTRIEIWRHFRKKIAEDTEFFNFLKQDKLPENDQFPETIDTKLTNFIGQDVPSESISIQALKGTLKADEID